MFPLHFTNLIFKVRRPLTKLTTKRHLRPPLLELYLDHDETTMTLTSSVIMAKTHTQTDKSCYNVTYDQPNVEAGQLVNHLRSLLLQLDLDHDAITKTKTNTMAMTMTKTYTKTDKSCNNVIYHQPNVEAGQLVDHLRSPLLQLDLDLLRRLVILAHTLVLW